MIRLSRTDKDLPEDERLLVLNIDHIISVCKYNGRTTVCVTGLLPDELPWHVTETVNNVFQAIQIARQRRG